MSISQSTAATLRVWAAVVVALVLVGTGIAKTISGFGNDPYLSGRDLITGLPARYLMIGTAAVEVAIAQLCWMYRHSIKGPILVLMLCLIFGVYRTAFNALFEGEMCPCLGYVFSSLGVTKAAASAIVTSSLVALIAAAGISLGASLLMKGESGCAHTRT